MANKYDNCNWSRCARNYNVLAVTLGPGGVAQGNDGTSLPCKGCYVRMREYNTAPIKVSIGTPASATLGVELSYSDTSTRSLWLPVTDVSQLYFYGVYFQPPSAQNMIDVLYFLG